MSLNQILQDVGTELQELFWRDDPRRLLGQEIHALKMRARQETASLAQLLSSIDELLRRVADKECRQKWLSARIEIYHNVGDRANAWNHALELDRVRKCVEEQRRQLSRFRKAYQWKHTAVEQLQRRLANLQGQA